MLSLDPQRHGLNKYCTVVDMEHENDYDDDNKDSIAVLLQKIHDQLRLEYPEFNISFSNNVHEFVFEECRLARHLLPVLAYYYLYLQCVL